MEEHLEEHLHETEHDDRFQETEPASQSQLPISYDALQAYLAEVRKIPLLTPEEERELAIRYRETGDMEAAYRLITANLRLVVKIALEYQRQWMLNLLDLVQEGNIGLMQAVKNFDPYRGVKLSYYASYWIKAYILKFIMDNWRLVKIGTTQMQRKLFFNLQKEKARLEKMGFYPGPARLAQALDTDEDKIIEMEQRLGDWEPSLDHPVGDDWRETRGDLLSADTEVFDVAIADRELQQIFNEKLSDFKESLDDKERDILETRILSDTPVTLQAIGDKYGISKERVRQVENRLIKKIRQYMEQQLPDFKRLELPTPSDE
ncbi:MAG: RNA polymerase factor sigma-32 [Desulfobacterota bacterium]|nr:RNA polymerase factor sigma-32 [Thermodesulfobacteriota bacterium]